MRSAAVQELASFFKDESGIFELLCDRALYDPFRREDSQYPDSDYESIWEIIHPRYIALTAIIEQYPNHPQTLQILRDRAEHDPDEKLREFAREKLAELEN